jgi:hypothetical protein
MSARNGQAANDSAMAALVPRWLAGDALDDLTPIAAPASADLSTHFTALEQAAIATALATPDICLIQGASSDGRVRVAHTVASRAATRSDRVLLLSPEPMLCCGRACADGARCLMCAAQAPAPKVRRTFWSWLASLFRARPPTVAASAVTSKIVAATYRDAPIGPFDLVIAADAHTLSDAEFTSVAERARRWVFIGGPSSHSPFHRLWQRLAFEPWVREGERIVCRLRPVPDRHREQLESEPVADRPEIELRILAEPTGEPHLAEVVFPPGMPIADAKCYVFEQLGEAPLCGTLGNGSWSETPEGITLDLDEPSGAVPSDVPLSNGIRFARSAGWSRESARTWVEQHCGRHDRGRTVRLDHRPIGPTEKMAGRAAETLA